jgi:hypothetical protein
MRQQAEDLSMAHDLAEREHRREEARLRKEEAARDKALYEDEVEIPFHEEEEKTGNPGPGYIGSQTSDDQPDVVDPAILIAGMLRAERDKWEKAREWEKDADESRAKRDRVQQAEDVERRLAASAVKFRREADARIKAALDERDRLYEEEYDEGQGGSGVGKPDREEKAEPSASSTPKIPKKTVKIKEPEKERSMADLANESSESEESHDDDESVKSVEEEEAAAATTSKKLGKRDPHKPPTSFWRSQGDPPKDLGSVSGGHSKFSGELKC